MGGWAWLTSPTAHVVVDQTECHGGLIRGEETGHHHNRKAAGIHERLLGLLRHGREQRTEHTQHLEGRVTVGGWVGGGRGGRSIQEA